MPVHTDWHLTVAKVPGPNRRQKILHQVTVRSVVAGTRRHLRAWEGGIASSRVWKLAPLVPAF
jgi:hypothetical protein